MTTYEAEERKTIMKQKKPLNEVIYLPEYYAGKFSQLFQEVKTSEILYWDFTKNVSETVKLQIESLLTFIVKTIKDREKRRNNYLLPLKYLLQYAEESGLQDLLKMELSQEENYTAFLKASMGKSCGSPRRFIAFCREILFMRNKEIDWSANVWYVDKLNMEPSRQSQGNNIKTFNFLDVTNVENRIALQKYIKYLLTLTSLNIGIIKIFCCHAKSLLRYLEEQSRVISDINQETVNRYFSTLLLEGISPQSYNNKIKAVTDFLVYLQRVQIVESFPIRVELFEKKVYPIVKRYPSLQEQLESFSEYVYDFPKPLCVMSCILLYTGIDKGKLFQLKDSHFYVENEESWLKIPETNRSIPIPEGLHLMVLRFATMQQIPIDSYLFYDNNGKTYTYQSFRKAIMRQCSQQGILDNEYVFRGNGYQIEFCKWLYKAGVSIQSIREYMGYTSDETVKKNLSIMDEKIIRASELFFQKRDNVLGGVLPVAKYDKMKECNQEENRKKAELAITEIKRMEAEGKKISVSELSKNTGLSKAFFYKNEDVRSVLDASTEQQREKNFVAIKEEVKRMSLERQVEFYEKKIKELIRENEILQAENAKLKQKNN